MLAPPRSHDASVKSQEGSWIALTAKTSSGDNVRRTHGTLKSRQRPDLSRRATVLKHGLFGAALIGGMAFGAVAPARATTFPSSGVATTYIVAVSGQYQIAEFGGQGGSGGADTVPGTSSTV